ncbi:hypothetical protein J3459_006013 [Metarhizium acridum]|nr:hypothetical protein J3459_006013 [Metarhizium acridum]
MGQEFIYMRRRSFRESAPTSFLTFNTFNTFNTSTKIFPHIQHQSRRFEHNTMPKRKGKQQQRETSASPVRPHRGDDERGNRTVQPSVRSCLLTYGVGKPFKSVPEFLLKNHGKRVRNAMQPCEDTQESRHDGHTRIDPQENITSVLDLGDTTPEVAELLCSFLIKYNFNREDAYTAASFEALLGAYSGTQLGTRPGGQIGVEATTERMLQLHAVAYKIGLKDLRVLASCWLGVTPWKKFKPSEASHVDEQSDDDEETADALAVGLYRLKLAGIANALELMKEELAKSHQSSKHV